MSILKQMKNNTSSFESNKRLQAPIGDYNWLPITELPITDKQIEKGCLAKYSINFPYKTNPSFISGVNAEVWDNDGEINVITAGRVWKVEGQKKPGRNSLIWLDPSLKSYLIDLAVKGIDVSERELTPAPAMDINVSMQEEISEPLSKSGIITEMMIKLFVTGEQQEIIGVRNLYVQLDNRFIEGTTTTPKLFVTLPKGNNTRTITDDGALPDSKPDCSIDTNFLNQAIIAPWKKDLDFNEIKEIILNLRNKEDEEEELDIDADGLSEDIGEALDDLE